MENNPKKAEIQLIFLGFISALVGIVCLLVTWLIYDLGGLTSISESATTGNKAGMLLPFALGCMFTYCISYRGYCLSERIIVKIMGVAFAVVALQVCYGYGLETKAGILGLSREASNWVHLGGAATGFGLMWVWIQFYFTKSNKDKESQTKQKRIRNHIYTACGAAMLCGILLMILDCFIPMGSYMMFIAEEFMLIPAGLAIVIKGGLFLKDKEIIVEADEKEVNKIKF